MEVGTPDGQRRTFRAGDVMLADDADTPGHTTTVLEGPSHQLWIPLDEPIWSVPTET